MKCWLYVLCRNVAVEWPFGYRFSLAPVKARDENLPDRIAVRRIHVQVFVLFSPKRRLDEKSTVQ